MDNLALNKKGAANQLGLAAAKRRQAGHARLLGLGVCGRGLRGKPIFAGRVV
jgi:hypothetical protein